jgi:hypothetical protein
MDRMRTEVQKERLVAMSSDPPVCFLNPVIRKILVSKTGLVPAGVETDSTDPIVDRCIVSVRPIHLQLSAMSHTRGVILAGLVFTNPQWILWI